MLVRQLCLIHHELPPSSGDSVRYFGRVGVVEACGSSRAFGEVLIWQDLYAHVVDLDLRIFSPPHSAHCIAEKFCFVGMELESSFLRCGAKAG